jgi:hypothetical protein
VFALRVQELEHLPGDGEVCKLERLHDGRRSVEEPSSMQPGSRVDNAHHWNSARETPLPQEFTDSEEMVLTVVISQTVFLSGAPLPRWLP